MIRHLLFLLCFTCAFAQREGNVWFFGGNAGLDFNNGSPIAVSGSSMATNEGCASISDASGNLLFYTNGATVWNRLHHIMQNGFAIAGEASSTQSAIIVKKPGSANLYYIFTTDSQAGPNGLSYTIVDMNSDDGLGAVILNSLILESSICEKLTVTRHANGTDYWIMSHRWNSNAYCAYKLTSAGIDISPVISSVGITITGTGAEYQGQMKISPDGQRIAAAIGGSINTLQLCDFDSSTGSVTNPSTLYSSPANGASAYGVEFSPNGKRLYLSDISSLSLSQFDLQAVDIPASSINIYSMSAILLCSLQLGPDGKLYLAEYNQGKLSVINNPDASGAACNLQVDAIDLGGSTSLNGLPDFSTELFYSNAQITALNGCAGESILFSLTSSSTITAASWDFGDGAVSNLVAPSHSYASAGNYSVSSAVMFSGGSRTVTKTVTVNALPVSTVPQDLEDCSANGFSIFDLTSQETIILNGQNRADFTIRYFAGASDQQTGTQIPNPETYTNQAAFETEMIFVEIENSNGCKSTVSFAISIFESPAIPAEIPSISKCAESHEPFDLTENESNIIGGRSGFSFSYFEDAALAIPINNPAEYIPSNAAQKVFVKVENTMHPQCFKIGEFSAQVLSFPDLAGHVKIEASDWTDHDNSIAVTIPGIDTASFLYSIDGIRFQSGATFYGLLPGLYKVYITNAAHCGQDVFETALLMYPKYFTPNGDGFHDRWNIIGAGLEPKLKVEIFDRLGKFISRINSGDAGWDGTYNGRQMPSSDYWFAATRNDGRILRGHFSMKR